MYILFRLQKLFLDILWGSQGFLQIISGFLESGKQFNNTDKFLRHIHFEVEPPLWRVTELLHTFSRLPSLVCLGSWSLSGSGRTGPSFPLPAPQAPICPPGNHDH